MIGLDVHPAATVSATATRIRGMIVYTFIGEIRTAPVF
jgi:hypothetical protein